MNYMSTINVIVKNEFEEICYVKTLKYDSKKMKDFDDIVSFVIKTLKWPKSVFCDYDAKTKQRIIVNDSMNKTGQLDWKIDFSKLKFKEVSRPNANSSITIIAVCYPVFLGLGSGIGEVLTFVEFLKIIFSMILRLYYYIFPYKLLSKKYNFSKLLIMDTIKHGDWVLYQQKNLSIKK